VQNLLFGVKKREKERKWKSKDLEKGLMQGGEIEEKGTIYEWRN